LGGLDRDFPVSGPIDVKEGHRPVFAPLRVAVFLLPWGAVFGVDDRLSLYVHTVKLCNELEAHLLRFFCFGSGCLAGRQ